MKFVSASPTQELEPVKADVLPMPANQPPTMLAYLHAAQSGADLERLEKLMDLHERWEDRQALKAFNQAMADFRSESMEILKTRYVDIAGGAKFWQAELGEICDEVIPNLSKYGLFHTWVPRRTENGEEEISCVIHHALGHKSEPTTIPAPMDKSGNKTEGDARTATRTRLQRYTFLMACGLAPKGMETAAETAAAASAVDKPKDIDAWMADAKALTDEGSARLGDLWEKTPKDIRRYIVTHEKNWWADMKAKAAKATAKEKAAS